jgi:hypothetical protein
MTAYDPTVATLRRRRSRSTTINRVETYDSSGLVTMVGNLARLCAHLVDENTALNARITKLEQVVDAIGKIEQTVNGS